MRLIRHGEDLQGVALDPSLFTGPAFAHGLLDEHRPDRVAVNVVSMDAGSRSHWHSHPGGQLLYVTEGSGLIQARDHEVQTLTAGDMVLSPPHEEHWHGADHSMSVAYLAISLGDTQFFE